MQIHLSSIIHAKRMAKTLHAHLASHGRRVKLSEAQEAIASMLGHASWHALSASVGSSAPSPMEHEIGEDERFARRARFKARLVSRLGLSDPEAAGCLDRLSPLAVVRGPHDAPDWRRRYLSFRMEHPLAGWPRSDDLQDGLFEILEGVEGGRRTILSGRRDHALPDGSMCTLLYGRGDASEGGTIDEVGVLLPVFAILVRKARVIASVRGFIAAPRLSSSYADMVGALAVAEPGTVSVEVVRACEGLGRRRDFLARTACSPLVRSTLVITHWARHPKLAPAGSGIDLVKAAAHLAARGDYLIRANEMAICNGPAQYAGPDGTGSAEPGYEPAVNALFRYAFWGEAGDLTWDLPREITVQLTYNPDHGSAAA